MPPKSRKKGETISASSAVEAETTDLETFATPPSPRRKMAKTSKRQNNSEGEGDKAYLRFKQVSLRMNEALMKGRSANECSEGMALEVMQRTADLEAILMELVMENERLKGRLSVLEERLRTVVAQKPVEVVAGPPAPTKKPVETWSLVVRSKDAKKTPKEVVSKVLKEVGPTLVLECTR